MTESSFPKSNGADSSSVVAMGIPAHLTNFIGRTHELAELSTLFAPARLLTLTGAGGSGKTRLAAEFAVRGCTAHSGRISWIPLAPVAEPDAVPRAVAAALNVRESAGRDVSEALKESLREGAALLVLDNCEHVIGACAALVDELLRACPSLRVLATSREPLGVDGEIAWLVPPLAMPEEDSAPTAEGIRNAEAVQLFVERARAARPSFALADADAPAVLQICRRLDGLPLAIELAAARIRVLTPGQIADRLDDAFALLGSGSRTALPRHRTLRATIEWSHDLLSAAERTLLARLAVFSGGFTLEAAEAICPGGEIEQGEVLDVLAALVDKSLVTLTETAGQPRYRLLETVRQFAAERIRESGEEAGVRQRHLAFFLRAAAEAAPHLPIISPTRALWIPRVLPEQDNFRSALAWTRSEQGSDPRAEIQLLADTWWLWHHLGQVREARQWMVGALRRSPDPAPSPARAMVLLGAGFSTWMQGDSVAGAEYLAQSVALWKQLGERAPFLVRALTIYAHILRDLGDLAGSRRAAEEAVAAATAGRGLPGDDAFALACLGSTVHAEGDWAAADEIYRDAELRWRRTGQSIGLAFTLWSRSTLSLDRGDPSEAARLARESIQTARTVPNLWTLCRPLESLAAALARSGELRTAVMLIGAAREIRDGIGAPVQPMDRARYDDAIAAMEAALGDDFDVALGAGRALTPERAVALALSGTDAPPHPVAPTRTAAAASAAPAPSSEPRTPALRVRALGPLQITSAEGAGDAGAWRLAKPRELLLYLLCHPEGQTRDQVGLALWPDASRAQVSNNFHVMLHRLRKAIGAPERIVAEGDRYRIAPGLEVEFDAALFESRAASALGPGDPAARLAALREALALYGGDFLEGEAVGDWHLEHRDRLQRLHLAALLALGDGLARTGDHAPAAEAYQRLLAQDPFREDVYRRLMTCHAHLGQRTTAMRLYQRLSALLEAEFGSGPEPETVALFEQLRSDQPV